MSKPVVCLLCGGQSPEHEISLLSAWNVFQALDRRRYQVLVVGIGRDGVWRLYGDQAFLQNQDNPRTICLQAGGHSCYLCRTETEVCLREFACPREWPVDIAFPMLHGANGEDGAIQGLFRMLGLAYVGCDQMSSANCMDKAVAKIILQANGLRTARAAVLRQPPAAAELSARAEELGLPLFVKPAGTGSSVGISKVKTLEELPAAMELAFAYDEKILLEEAILGREIECAVLSDGEEIFCPPPGEVIPRTEFYSYEAKYLLADGAQLCVPASLSSSEVAEVCALAIRAFQALGCDGLARVDFFLPADGRWVVNEINTLPGFTKISLYPQLLQVAGLPYPELVHRLIQAACRRQQRMK